MNNDLNNNIGSENSQLSNNQPTVPVTNEVPTMQSNPMPNSNEFNQPLVNNNLNSNKTTEQPINKQTSQPEFSTVSPESQNEQPLAFQNVQLSNNNIENQYANNNVSSNPAYSFQTPINNPNNIPTNNHNSVSNNSNSKSQLIKYGGIIGIIVICIIGIFIGMKVFKNKDKNNNNGVSLTETLNSSSSFFLSDTIDGETKYALFSDEGRKITDFIFDSKRDFFNGAAYVEKDGKGALIDASGKEIVSFDKYEFYSYPFAGLYQVRDSEKNYYLINSKGKVVYTFNEKYDTDLCDFGVNELYAYAIDGDKIIIFNYEGKKLKEYQMREEANTPRKGYDPLYDYYGETDSYLSIYYDGDLTIYRNSDFSVVYNGKIDYPYKLFRTEYDKIFYLSPVTYIDSDMGKDRKNLMLMNNKFKEFDEDLYGKKIRPDGSFGTGDYYMDVEKNNYVMSPSSSNHYVEYYVNGNLVKKIEDQYINYDGENGVYVVHLANEDYKETWYNENGERVLNESYAYLGFLDSNDRAIAQKEKKGQYILIDRSGKQIGNIYDYISREGEYYIVKKNDLVGVIDKDGTELIHCIYKNYEINSYANKDYILFTTEEEIFKLYSLSDNKEIASFNKKPSLRDHYLEIYESGTTKYYTYNGVNFYET